MTQHHPHRSAWILFLLPTCALAAVLHWYLDWHPLLAWLLPANLVALALWAHDKRRSRKENGGRIPELVLHGMALLGATPASLVGMSLLRHKTRKRRFTLLHPLLLLAQIALAAYCFW